MAFVFHLVCYGWILFRAPDTAKIFEMTNSLFHPWGEWDPAQAARLAWCALPLAVVQLIQFTTGKLQFLDFRWAPLEFRVMVYSAMFYMIVFQGGQPRSFIYFQF